MIHLWFSHASHPLLKRELMPQTLQNAAKCAHASPSDHMYPTVTLFHAKMLLGKSCVAVCFTKKFFQPLLSVKHCSKHRRYSNEQISPYPHSFPPSRKKRQK